MEIKQVFENKKQYMDLLFLADEQEDMIDRYLDKGDMFVLLDPEPLGEIDARNISATESRRRMQDVICMK